MKKLLPILTLSLIACTDERPIYKVQDHVVPKKYCLEVCMRSQFSMFHNSGDSWGTGSSSMNGLSQSKIYDRVKKACDEFYSDEQCCKRPYHDYNHQVIQTQIHSYDYGACVK